MTGFSWLAVDHSGRRIRGFLQVDSASELNCRLHERGLLLVSHEPSERSASRPGWSPGGCRTLVEVTRAVASLLTAGMPLTRALSTAGALVGRGPLADALESVRVRVEQGGSVSAALAAHPNLFDPLYVGAVRAGERGSDLAAAFDRLADHVERQERVRQRLLSASIYPLILALVGGVALIALLLFVVPRFVDLIADAGAEVPAATALLLALSEFLRERWVMVLAAVAVTLVVIASIGSTVSGRRVVADIVLKLPLIGAIRREVLAARFARLLALLLRGGAPVLAALDDAAASIADARAAEEVARVRARAREGESLHVALTGSAVFPEVLSRLVAVGEESGRLIDFLERAAIMLEERTQRATERLVTLLEPAMIVAFGGLVALVAMSLLQAVYGLNAGGLG